MTQPPPAPRALPVIAGFAALALAVAIAVPWLWLLLAGLPSGGPARPTVSFGVLVLEGTATVLLFCMLLATWFATPWFERRGVLPAAAGLLLNAVWQALEDLVAVWIEHPMLQLVPQSLGVAGHSLLMANLGVALISVILLVVGAVLLLSRPDRD